MKLLIIRFSSIGDIVLTTPVIRCIKEQRPEVEIHYLTKASFESVLTANPYIDRLHVLQPDLKETIRQLKLENFDYVIDLHNNLRTRLIKLQLKAKAYSFNKLNVQKWLYVKFKINLLPSVHIVDRYLETASFLGVKNDGKGLDYFLLKQYQLETLLPVTHQKYIGVVIGAQHATKRLPVHKLIELCNNISSPVILMGGKDDELRGQEIAAASGAHVYNACGKFSLDESAFLVKMAGHIITHDTGLMHIAAAFDKPITSVWGNTVPEFGMYPYKVLSSKILEVKGLSCRPCSKIGYKKCPLGHFKCMNEINMAQLADSSTGI
ncbi:glycosyl transferase [Pedobacter sp. HMF7647]|uniref:Glycosyl transferase n=1 Tax=Hufsiella arboris TaxID=2695275 RepID=A0A7K1YD71_9SPHI|nr:glycosyl transferase [Hufsiella arboris]